MKKNIIATLFLIPVLSYGQNVIYKCTSSTGDINYLNISSLVAKSSGCIKTDLSIVQKNPVSYHESKHNSGPSNMLIYNDEKKNRDNKRQTILSKELQDEEEQLNIVNSMLKNLNGNKTSDPIQIEQLSKLQVTHTKNIETLKKEVGINNISTVATTLPPTTLPLNNLKIEKAVH